MLERHARAVVVPVYTQLDDAAVGAEHLLGGIVAEVRVVNAEHAQSRQA